MKRRGSKTAPSKSKRSRRKISRPAITAVVVFGLAIAAWFFLQKPEEEPERIRSVEEFARLGEAAMIKGDLEVAEELLRRGIQQYPDDSSLRLNLGLVLNNQSFEVREFRGKRMPVLPTSLERVRAAHAALALYKEVAEREPGEAEPHSQAGTLYAIWGLVEDALMELERAYDLGERREDYLIHALSILQHQLGQSDSTLTNRR